MAYCDTRCLCVPLRDQLEKTVAARGRASVGTLEAIPPADATTAGHPRPIGFVMLEESKIKPSGRTTRRV